MVRRMAAVGASSLELIHNGPRKYGLKNHKPATASLCHEILDSMLQASALVLLHGIP